MEKSEMLENKEEITKLLSYYRRYLFDAATKEGSINLLADFVDFYLRIEKSTFSKQEIIDIIKVYGYFVGFQQDISLDKLLIEFDYFEIDEISNIDSISNVFTGLELCGMENPIYTIKIVNKENKVTYYTKHISSIVNDNFIIKVIELVLDKLCINTSYQNFDLDKIKKIVYQNYIFGNTPEDVLERAFSSLILCMFNVEIDDETTSFMDDYQIDYDTKALKVSM